MFTVINNEKNGRQENWLTFSLKMFCQKKKIPKTNEHPVEEMACNPSHATLTLLDCLQGRSNFRATTPLTCKGTVKFCT